MISVNEKELRRYLLKFFTSSKVELSLVPRNSFPDEAVIDDVKVSSVKQIDKFCTVKSTHASVDCWIVVTNVS